MPPGNDNIADSFTFTLDHLTEVRTISNEEATAEPSEPAHVTGDPASHSIWFRFLAIKSSLVEINTCGSAIDTQLAVYTGPADVTNLSLWASNDDGATCGNGASFVRFNATSGTTYRIALDGKGAAAGPTTIEIEIQPQNNDIARATAIPPGQGSVNGNIDADAEPGEPDHAVGDDASHSIWYRFTAANDGIVIIDTCGSVVDTLLAVYTGPADVTALTPLIRDDDGAIDTCGPGNSRVNFNATEGTTYRVALDGKGTATGSTQLSIRVQAGNVNFADATELNGDFVSASGTSFQGGAEGGEPDHAGLPAVNSVWFKWTPLGDGMAEIDSCDTFFDTRLAVYTGTAVNALTAVASNDDAVGCGNGTQSRVSFPVDHETTYRIALDGNGPGGSGSFSITLGGPPANDLFEFAQDLGGSSATAGGSSEYAGKQAGEDDHAGDRGGHSVWFKWTPLRSGLIRLNTCESAIDTVLAVYTGNAVDSLTEVEKNDDGGLNVPCTTGDSALTFNATAGTTYRIAVDGKGGDEGFYQLDLDVPPDNDNFADARLIGGETIEFDSSKLVAATQEEGEPNHASQDVERSVWYRWTATVPGTVDVRACSGNIADLDVVIAAYTGSSLAALTPVGGADLGLTPECADFDFTAVAGTTYRIAVDAKEPPPPSSDGFVDFFLTGPEDTVDPDTEILSGPSGPVASSSASFTYAAVPSFDGESFECSLDGAPFALCPAAGRTFTALAEGPHTFAVSATDFDNNSDESPATRSFTVDTIAPETTITSGPSGEISSSDATFTYAAGVGGGTPVSFECRLDGGAFAACPNAGQSLSGLAAGPHSFAVRALDAAGNTDATPATQSFSVAAAPVDLCTPAREQLKAAKAKLRKAKAADRPDEDKIARLKKKVRKKKAAVAQLC